MVAIDFHGIIHIKLRQISKETIADGNADT